MKKYAEISTLSAGNDIDTNKDEGYWPNTEVRLDNPFFRKDPLLEKSRKKEQAKADKHPVKRMLEKKSALEDGGDTSYNGIVDVFTLNNGYGADGWNPESKVKGVNGKINHGGGFAGHFNKAVIKKRSKNVRDRV